MDEVFVINFSYLKANTGGAEFLSIALTILKLIDILVRIFNFDCIILFTGPEFNHDRYFYCDKLIKRPLESIYFFFFVIKSEFGGFFLNINMKWIRVVGVVFERWGQNCKYTYLRRCCCPIIFSAPQSTVRST